MSLQFLGASGTVTGSRYLVEAGTSRMLVDCGLFQGYKQLRLRNWAPFPVPPESLHAVLLTHAHLDHSGYLPRLCHEGFSGRVHATEASCDLCRILLPDSARLLEDEASYANRHGFSKHAPALPLYSEADAARCLEHFSCVDWDTALDLAPGLQATFRPAGHILGASSIALNHAGKTLVFSGDIGRQRDILMKPPARHDHADYLVIESTYGNRLHAPDDDGEALGRIIRETAARGGVVVIPAFAVGRVQALLYQIHLLKERAAIPPSLPVYLNSPMAIDVTELYRRHRRLHRLTPEQCKAMCHVAKNVNSVEESIALNRPGMPKVIIAGSGMATGGRVLHHLKAFAPDPRSTILFAGFQAGGTRGAAMLGGATEIKIHGELVRVRAKVACLDNYSAHADQEEILEWLGGFREPPRTTFITHGEPEAADVLRKRIEDKLGWRCHVPEQLERVMLG
ncbi:MBL fold metallo-hydrolase RNA specificity domain-containing protein [Noviherbaspirillum galbum]|uniref:MBL fold metallo-hydrolase n=1 Tax=Noviherbaspirillum galbum TaxID=2709383 RepID=A0A6B3SU49_9BURK|nr:MBL fold metallo-hydrolase [Noviherbaspirillum galbum]NEX61159.1 MBL fold metallo-hydrolase [Noviherbaspirillum galbum]